MIGLPVLLLLPVFFSIYDQGTEALKQERNRTMHIADIIALNGAISSQQPRIEKALTNVLNTDELLSFIENPQDPSSKMVLDGLFLSLREQQIVRFVIYDSNYNILLQQAEKLPPIPACYRKACSRFSGKPGKTSNFTSFSAAPDKLPTPFLLPTVWPQ